MFTIDLRVILSIIVATGVYALLLKFLQKMKWEIPVAAAVSTNIVDKMHNILSFKDVPYLYNIQGVFFNSPPPTGPPPTRPPRLAPP